MPARQNRPRCTGTKKPARRGPGGLFDRVLLPLCSERRLQGSPRGALGGGGVIEALAAHLPLAVSLAASVGECFLGEHERLCQLGALGGCQAGEDARLDLPGDVKERVGQLLGGGAHVPLCQASEAGRFHREAIRQSRHDCPHRHLARHGHGKGEIGSLPHTLGEQLGADCREGAVMLEELQRQQARHRARLYVVYQQHEWRVELEDRPAPIWQRLALGGRQLPNCFGGGEGRGFPCRYFRPRLAGLMRWGALVIF